MLGNPVRTQRKVGKSAQIPGRKEGRELIPQGLSFSLPLIPCPSLHLPPAGKPSQRNSKDDSIILIPALCGLQGDSVSSLSGLSPFSTLAPLAWRGVVLKQ